MCNAKLSHDPKPQSRLEGRGAPNLENYRYSTLGKDSSKYSGLGVQGHRLGDAEEASSSKRLFIGERICGT